MELRHKTVLVTGGGTGIGQAACLDLAARGAFVAVGYSRSEEGAAETVRLIRERGGSAAALRADLGRDADVRRMVDQTVRTFGALDGLVNNAGMTRHIPLDDLEAATDDIWNELFDVNVLGMFRCVRAAAPYLKAAGGAVVNLGSIAGSTGSGSSLPYAVSKSAVHGLTRSLARALAPRVRVNAVVPGYVPTRWWAGNEERLQALLPELPLQRAAAPGDVARLICAALEQEAMTGQLLTVDSGQTL